MQTHLFSVTGVPVCPYYAFSRQPLRGEFNNPLTMPRTERHLSEEKGYCILFRFTAFILIVVYFIIGFCVCQ